MFRHANFAMNTCFTQAPSIFSREHANKDFRANTSDRQLKWRAPFKGSEYLCELREPEDLV